PIGRDMPRLDIGRAASIGVVMRTGVAGGDAAAPVAEARIEAGDDAGKVAPQGCGVAVAVELAPGAEALRPECDVVAGGRRGLDRRRLRVGERVRQSLVREGGLRSTHRERS